MAEAEHASGPDFAQGIALADVAPGATIGGRVGDEAVLLSRFDDGWFAVSASCTHYGGPLAKGLHHEGTARCPWHHACFDLRTGEALKAPAFDPLDRWQVETEGDRVFVRAKLEAAEPEARPTGEHPKRILIVGGGAAGFAAAEMLRRLGYKGSLTMLSEDDALPCDRPNLSKDYLAGTAPEEWVFLKDESFFRERDIDIRLGTKVTGIDTGNRTVAIEGGESLGFDALLLATGAEPIRLPTPGFDLPNVHALRSFADAKAIIAAAENASSAAVIGASFIGLEAAAALRHRKLPVHVIAPDAIPMERVMGPDIGKFVRALHERHGVQFHLGHTATGYDGRTLTLDDGTAIEADLVIAGVGVKPRVALAETAGLAIDNGVVVDAYLETSVPGIYAAGDIANYPEAEPGRRARVEHWVVAERQGQVAAANMLWGRERHIDVPFFWSRHYSTSILYVGHAGKWDQARVDGSPADGDCTVRFYEAGVHRASASIGRAMESLCEELRLEQPSRATETA